MKKLLVALLSLTLIAGFSMTASALDFKLSGGWHAAGTYQNNPDLLGDPGRYSRADVYTRTRMMPVLSVADGLTFTMRFDALEKKWGDTNFKTSSYAGASTGNTDDSTSSRRFYSSANPNAGNAKLQENIEFERAYVTFKTAAGIFDVGYQQSGVWGTKGLQQDSTRPRLKWTIPAGPWTLLAIWEKKFDGGESPSNSNATTKLTDADNDNYNLAFIYNNGQNFQGGVLYQYTVDNRFRQGGATANAAYAGLGYGSAAGFSTKVNLLAPYAQATFGNLFVEGEVMYFWGKLLQQETPTAANPDVDLSGLGIFAHAKMAFGPGYLGLQFHYTSGEKYDDPTKSAFYPGPTTTWTPAIILLDDDMADWMGARSNSGLNQSSGKTNSTIYSAYLGYNLNPRLNFELDVTYALATEKALSRTTAALDNKLGTEVDISATYRIYDNLTYTIAAGYLWTGDYFKGANPNATIGDNYVFLNRLILAF